jgi:WD40 repeat protein
MLISCSGDKNIIFYIKEDAYKKDYQISIDKSCYCVIQVKDNEICFSDSDDKIYFFDLNERKIKATVSNLNKSNDSWRTWLLMISKDLLIIPGQSKLTVVNVNEYKIRRIIDIANSSNFYGICLLNQKMILAGDKNGTIFQFKIEGDNLILTSKKEKAHNNKINFLLNMGDGFVASGSDDNTIKIW